MSFSPNGRNESNDEDMENAFERPFNWFGILIAYPRRAFFEISKKVLFY